MWSRIVFASLLAWGFVCAWQKLDSVPIKVVGQPSITGMIQQQEQRFFEQLAATTGLPLEVRYTPNDRLGIKDTYQLLMLKTGALDLVSLRFLQNATVEPGLLGVDLLGASSDFGTARAAAEVYAPLLDRLLRRDFNAKLLGVWPFGPQVFFCRRRIAGLRDLAGLKVRVGSENFAPLIAFFGGTAVVLPIEDVKDALRQGLVDCAITSAMSGNAAGWPQYSTHFFGLSTQLGINGYLINLTLWDRLSRHQQATLETAVKTHVAAIWANAERFHEAFTACNVGGPCAHGVPYHLVNVIPRPEDHQRLQAAFEQTTFRDWSARCDRLHPGCSEEWRQTVAPVLGIPLGPAR